MGVKASRSISNSLISSRNNFSGPTVWSNTAVNGSDCPTTCNISSIRRNNCPRLIAAVIPTTGNLTSLRASFSR